MMANDNRENYGLEPEGEHAPDAAPVVPGRKPEVARGENVQPIELEGDTPPPRASSFAKDDDGPPNRSVKDLDVCPSCGASMRGTDALVCLRCGFDLKTMRQIKTETGVAVATETEQMPPLVRPGKGDVWLPATVAAICGGFLAVCYLAGVRGLFPEIDAAILANERGPEIGIGERFIALLRFAVLVGMWVACGLGALAFLAALLGMKLVEDIAHLRIAAIRMLAIVAAARVVTLINFATTSYEWVVEAILQLAIFVGLSIVFFRLNPRDGATLGGAALVLFMLLWCAAWAVVWATGG
jgi:hypothetical protein